MRNLHFYVLLLMVLLCYGALMLFLKTNIIKGDGNKLHILNKVRNDRKIQFSLLHSKRLIFRGFRLQNQCQQLN